MKRLLKLSAFVVLVTSINLVTMLAVIGPITSSAVQPGASENGDVNGDGYIDIGDPLYLLMFLFQGGPPPVAIAADLTEEQLEILGHMSIEYVDDGQGGTNKTIRFTGVNVQVVNGLGATNGYPENPDSAVDAVVNGAGNLIVGYLEPSGVQVDRTGSHNIIGGLRNSYSSFGGVVFGRANTISGAVASVLGGQTNTASGGFSSIVGGRQHIASGDRSTIVGGKMNVASADTAVVVAGRENEASAGQACVIAGRYNLASGGGACVSGGNSNIASGDQAVVVGGQSNLSDGFRSVVSGGLGRIVTGDYDWAAGSCLFCEQ